MSCLEDYECRTRGCYAESVGMSMYCPGVASREAEVTSEQCWCDTDNSITETYAVDCPVHGHYAVPPPKP
jgi:hypothetical protein